MLAGPAAGARRKMDRLADSGINPALGLGPLSSETRGMHQRSLTKLLILLTLAAVPGAASGHAILLDSTPEANATVTGPAIDFMLRYNTRIDQKRSRLTLTLPDRSTEILPIADSSPEAALQASAVLPPGLYSLRWQVLAVDGHITRGDVPFTVGGD
jgi:methionine-rich copper-binding protein CopC